MQGQKKLDAYLKKRVEKVDEGERGRWEMQERGRSEARKTGQDIINSSKKEQSVKHYVESAPQTPVRLPQPPTPSLLAPSMEKARPKFNPQPPMQPLPLQTSPTPSPLS
jgi:hypothetical protein